MSALDAALKQLQQGGMIILVDDESRENEGDLVLAAEHATPEAVNFMAKHGRGLICLTLTSEQVDRLHLPPMTASNKARRSTAFTVSIEARDGITTGISAHDRAHTIQTAINPDVKDGEIVSPGHIFPLRAAEGGVLVRQGHTEGSVDLMRLAGQRPAGVICEIMSEDGQMARRPELEAFAKAHDLPILTVDDIMRHRLETETLVTEVAQAELPSQFTEQPLKVHAFRSSIDGSEHLALVKYPLPAVPLVRVHSECLTGEAFGSLRCDCGPQLQKAMRLISESDGGILIYLRNHEGRGIGLANKIKAYAMQDVGMDTHDANTALGFAPDERNYAVAAQILRTLGVSKLTLLSNNPLKAKGLQELGIEVVKTRPLQIEANPFNEFYLATKRDRFGHTFNQPIGN
jgi:3,4-dihydroxy 2-butanone 4-phosphate synthase / GTP cyclohydrolase II